MSGDGTYAPKSPDLSSFYSAGPTPPAEPELERASAPQQQHFLSPQSQPDFSHQLQQYPPSSSSYQQQPHAPQPQLGQHPPYQRDTPPQPFAPAAAAAAAARPTHDPSQPPGFSVGVGYSPATTTPSTQHEYYPPRAQSFPQPGPGYPVTQASPHQQQQPPQTAFHQPAYRGSGSFQYQYQPAAGHAAQFPAETAQVYAAQAQVHHQPPYDYPPQTVPAAVEDEGYVGPPGHHLPATATFPLLDHQQMPPRRAAAAAAAAAVAAQAAASSGGDSGPETQLGTGGGGSSPSPPTTTTNTSTTPGASTLANPPPPLFEPGPVKTKFPTARIKRIMQADEEVGKVAQQTPIAVGKALELFMVALVSRSAGIARARSSKRVSAAMLRQAVESDEQWDFLGEIVAKVDVGGGGGDEKGAGKGGKGGGKVESESEDEGIVMGGGAGGAGEGSGSGAGASGAKRKRGAGGGRKKKVQ